METNRAKILKREDLFWVLYLWITGFVIIFCIVFNVTYVFADVLRVRTNSTVAGEKILLGDIADTKVPSLKNIVLGKSPKPSKSFNLSGYKIAAILRAKKLPENLSIELPETITVTRAFQTLSKDRVKSYFENELKKKLKGKSFKVKRLKIRGLKKYPPGDLTLKVDFGSDDLSGHTVGRIDVLLNGKKTGRVSAILWIDRFEKGAALLRDLRRNSVISKGDVELIDVNVSRYRNSLISDLNQVIGKKVKRSLKKGYVIKSREIERAPLISKGSVVRLVAKRGNLVVETIGKAKNDGFKGETILIENISSKRTVAGKVIDRSTVSAFF